jgi:rRNA maturation endonuclease Nob1
MIFDLYDALLITVGLICAVFAFVDYKVKGEIECKHCFAEFQSTGKRKCIDCGYEETIRKPYYPKHQR